MFYPVLLHLISVVLFWGVMRNSVHKMGIAPNLSVNRRTRTKWKSGMGNKASTASSQDRATVNRGDSLPGKLTTNLIKVIGSRGGTIATSIKH